MPIIKSAKKALRQSAKRRIKNIQKKKQFKDALKEIKKHIAAGKKEEAEKLIPLAYKALDKAAKTGVIKRNTASRKKSRLVKQIKNSFKPAV